MAKTQVGLIYPRARGEEFRKLNEVIDDLIEAVVQCYFCTGTFPKKGTDAEQYAYIWCAVEEYAEDVLAYHKYHKEA